MSTKRELIQARLEEALSPSHLEVENESHRHNVPKGAETHFKVVVVSSSFNGQNLVARHRLVYGALDSQLKSKAIHALAIHAFSPAEWQARGAKGGASSSASAAASPDCLGGSKHDRKN